MNNSYRILTTFFTVFILLCNAMGFEQDRIQRYEMLRLICDQTNTPEDYSDNSTVSSSDTNCIYGYTIVNNSNNMIKKLKFRHILSNFETTVDVFSDSVIKQLQREKSGFIIRGLLSGANSEWEFERFFKNDPKIYTIEVPAKGNAAVKGVYLTVVWSNGKQLQYKLPYSGGSIAIYNDSVVVWSATTDKREIISPL